MFRPLLTRAMVSQVVRLCSDIGTKRLEGKVAVVTGSTEGIGYAVAERLGKEGAKVVICSRKQNNVDAALARLKSKNLSVTGIPCHIGNASDRAKLFKHVLDEHGGMNIFVSNAAVSNHIGSVFDITEAQWDKMFEVNVKSVFFSCKEALPLFKNFGGGSITIVSSIAAYRVMEQIGPYGISKTALLGMTKALAPECGEMNIRVNGVSPGIIVTKFSKNLWDDEELTKTYFNEMSIKRYGEAEEIGSTVAFLASEDASYITGETIVAAGGMRSKL